MMMICFVSMISPDDSPPSSDSHNSHCSKPRLLLSILPSLASVVKSLSDIEHGRNQIL